MYYSIYDGDTGYYLHTGRNSETKRDAQEAYLSYREPDIGAWWRDNETVAPKFHKKYGNKSIDETKEPKWGVLFEEWSKEVSDQFVRDDMAMCNFILEEHNEKLPEE